jgi:glutathionylspermidine synthase
MKREPSAPRHEWERRLDAVGLTYHSCEGAYWREDACYAFDAAEIEVLETATDELHQMCLEIVNEVIAQDRFDRLAIPALCHEAIRKSWKQQQPSLYGRFDFRYDGTESPVLLEYNADTPTSLIEASVAQWHWVEETHEGQDQFNSLHEKLIGQWVKVCHGSEGLLHVTGLAEHLEDAQTVSYLQDTAQQAGLRVVPIPIEEIGWDLKKCRFVDRDSRAISAFFKLYPWEWLVAEPFGRHLLQSSVQVIEPAWKMILSNKALLALLWERFPGHPNLLPAYFESYPLGTTYVRKPFLSREGANVAIVTPEHVAVTPGPYSPERSVYQAFAPLPNFDGWHPVVGSWIIGDEPAGIGIRESTQLVTTDKSRFVPHYCTPIIETEEMAEERDVHTESV